MCLSHPYRSAMVCLISAALAAAPAAGLDFGPEQLVPSGGIPIDVPGYSVPAMADFTGDGLADLIVGQGSGSSAGMVRIYTNIGSAGAPAFDGFFYAQSAGADLTLTGAGCLGLASRGYDWDADGLTDLIIGAAGGDVLFYENTGSASSPAFAAPAAIQAGGSDVKVNARAVPALRDWDGDGDVDLIVGAHDSHVRVYLNDGTSTSIPHLQAPQIVQDAGADLAVPSFRAAPDFVDFTGDGVTDLLTGNTNGQLLLYPNTGTVQAPAFDGYVLATSEGAVIDLPGSPRSRPFVTDWNADGLPDVLVGAEDGQVHLYQGVPEPATAALLLCGAAGLLRRRRR